MTADEAKQLKAGFEKWERARETATQAFISYMKYLEQIALGKDVEINYDELDATKLAVDKAKLELDAYIAANTSVNGNVPDTFYALEVEGALCWTKYFTTLDLAQKALQKDKDEIRHRMGVKVIEDTPNTFVFLLGWEEHRSSRCIKEYIFTA